MFTFMCTKVFVVVVICDLLYNFLQCILLLEKCENKLQLKLKLYSVGTSDTLSQKHIYV